MNFKISVIAIFTFFTGSVHAADLDPPYFSNPPIPPTFEAPPTTLWSGPYFGLQAGYGISKLMVETWCDEFLSEDFPGGRFGGFVGQNWLLASGFVAGIEGDLGYDWNGRAFNGAKEVGTGLTASGRARLGHEVGNALFYVAGGWTGANVYLKEPEAHKFANGWTLGLGVDWAISEKTFVRAEYRFNRFDEVSLRNVDTQFDQSAFNVGLAVKF